MKKVFNWLVWFLKIIPLKYWICVVLTIMGIIFGSLCHTELTAQNAGLGFIYLILGVLSGCGALAMIIGGSDVDYFLDEKQKEIAEYYSYWRKDRPNG